MNYADQLNIVVPEPSSYEQLRGRGAKATIEGKAVLVGNPALSQDNGIVLPIAVESSAETPVHVAVDGRLAGVMFIADTLRPGARETLAKLKATGVKRIVMLTGDNAATAQAVASALGVDEVHSNLLPED